MTPILSISTSGCGGDSGESEENKTTSLLRTQADAAVASGLVGVALGQVTRDASSIAFAGKRRLGQVAAVEPSDVFAIGSTTKAMTCAAIAAYAEQGGPALSLTVPQAFPQWAGEVHPGYAQVTLSDLLHHRGGLPAFNDGEGADVGAFFASVGADPDAPPATASAPARRAYFSRWLLAQPPVPGVTPGRDFLYSNAGYVVAAAMVEAHGAKSFEGIFDEVLAKPLALQGSWRSEVPGPRDVVWGHEGPMGTLAVVEATPELLAMKDWLDALGPAGHWACTGAAYAQWLRWHVLALGGEHTPLPQAYVDGLRSAADNRYVWGWQSVALPGRVVLTHVGHVPGFMSYVVLDRGGEFAVYGLTNTAYSAADGSSWVAGRIDKALAAVLEAQSIRL